jgi:hypothetical protein
MINKEMNDKSKTKLTEKSPTGTKPNEVGGVYFSSSIKIFDPNSNEVLVQKRGDD